MTNQNGPKRNETMSIQMMWLTTTTTLHIRRTNSRKKRKKNRAKTVEMKVEGNDKKNSFKLCDTERDSIERHKHP